MERKILSFQVDVTITKIILWVSSFWMFFALLLSITNAVEINDYLFGHSGHGHSSGDFGIIITITTWLSAIIPLFVKGKLDKIFGGIFLFILALICFIGSLVTSASAATFLGWSIPCLIIGTIGVLWILEGTNIVNLQKKSHNKTPDGSHTRIKNPQSSSTTPPTF